MKEMQEFDQNKSVSIIKLKRVSVSFNKKITKYQRVKKAAQINYFKT